ncbi:hypothetical protein EIP86_007364 [Pleurotus ostreatoroseus]|nr:hypothetical protein EIP86_007364 [Pleurotus ostreatoroseus]
MPSRHSHKHSNRKADAEVTSAKAPVTSETPSPGVLKAVRAYEQRQKSRTKRADTKGGRQAHNVRCADHLTVSGLSCACYPHLDGSCDYWPKMMHPQVGSEEIHDDDHEAIENEGAPTEEDRPMAIEVSLVELLKPAKTRKTKAYQQACGFEVVPNVRSVLALDEVVTSEPEIDEPWECIDWDEDDPDGNNVADELSYAKVLTGDLIGGHIQPEQILELSTISQFEAFIRDPHWYAGLEYLNKLIINFEHPEDWKPSATEARLFGNTLIRMPCLRALHVLIPGLHSVVIGVLNAQPEYPQLEELNLTLDLILFEVPLPNYPYRRLHEGSRRLHSVCFQGENIDFPKPYANKIARLLSNSSQTIRSLSVLLPELASHLFVCSEHFLRFPNVSILEADDDAILDTASFATDNSNVEVLRLRSHSRRLFGHQERLGCLGAWFPSVKTFGLVVSGYNAFNMDYLQNLCRNVFAYTANLQQVDIKLEMASVTLYHWVIAQGTSVVAEWFAAITTLSSVTFEDGFQKFTWTRFNEIQNNWRPLVENVAR